MGLVVGDDLLLVLGLQRHALRCACSRAVLASRLGEGDLLLCGATGRFPSSGVPVSVSFVRQPHTARSGVSVSAGVEHATHCSCLLTRVAPPGSCGAIRLQDILAGTPAASGCPHAPLQAVM